MISFHLFRQIFFVVVSNAFGDFKRNCFDARTLRFIERIGLGADALEILNALRLGLAELETTK